MEKLIETVKVMILPFIRAADEAASFKVSGKLAPNEDGTIRNILVTSRRPEETVKQLSLSLPEGEGCGEDGLLSTIETILDSSVNTWDQGFMSKLYSSTNAVRT